MIEIRDSLCPFLRKQLMAQVISSHFYSTVYRRINQQLLSLQDILTFIISKSCAFLYLPYTERLPSSSC